MKKILKYIVPVTILIASGLSVNAGNPDRAGESGAYELLINGWGRSSGLFSMNSANIKGLEATTLNTAGLTYVKKTEVIASYTNWFTGSGVNIINAGIAQKFKKSNVIAVNIASFNFGNIERTTVTNPEGGIGTFKPSFLNIGLSYAKSFSKSIHAGITARMVNERTSDANAMGLSLDAGIQYVTGKREQIHFGVSIRNVGTTMKFTGDGLNFRAPSPDGNYSRAEFHKSQKFNLPSQLNIGAAYDIYMGKAKKAAVSSDDADKADEASDDKATVAKPDNRLTICFNFTSNSVGKDHLGLGMEYGFKEMFMLRVAYRYERGILSAVTLDNKGSTTIFTGLSTGLTFETPLKKGKDSRLGFDYSYRMTNKLSGVHTVGIRFAL
jgi:hypothetical protein